MSASEKVTDTAVNLVADAAEEVAGQAENFAEYARRLNRAKVQFYLLGMAVGGLTGAVIAYKTAYSRAETKYTKIADAEVEEMRRHYQEKGKALEAAAAKGDLETIVTERGYVEPDEEEDEKPPMAVQPGPVEGPIDFVVKPPTVEGRVPEEEEVRHEDASQVQNIFEKPPVDHEWNWHEERRKRSPDIPYVIHVDEKYELDYQIVTLTYYDGDDVLCQEDDSIIAPEDWDRLIGEGNLNRFGHGSNDPSIVYVRNDQLELIYEIVKSDNYYAEEVHGFSHTDYGKNLERMRARERAERDEQED